MTVETWELVAQIFMGSVFVGVVLGLLKGLFSKD